MFQHSNPNYISTIVFEPKEKEALLDWESVFETTKLFETVVKVIKTMKAYNKCRKIGNLF